MLQIVEGREVYVVEFDTVPDLPITGDGEETIYAQILDQAIRDGVIKEPGKYGLALNTPTVPETNLSYTVYVIND